MSSAVVERTTSWATWRRLPRPERFRLGGLFAYGALITLLFSGPLSRLAVYAFQHDLHSHVLLVPLIAGYLVYLRAKTPLPAFRSSIAPTLALAALGLAVLGVSIRVGEKLSLNDGLALLTLAYVTFVAAGGFLFLGTRFMTAVAFPFVFLLFMIPLPDAVVRWLETASVAASADAAELFFRLTGTPLLREGAVLALPGISLEVAEQCSGIRSSWVLLITSLLASHLMLTSAWRRVVLVAFVIPLGIVRNGFRILVIGLLCVHVGPHMIDSMIHRRGGPVFFMLSLVPLFLLLLWLRRQEHPPSALGRQP